VTGVGCTALQGASSAAAGGGEGRLEVAGLAITGLSVGLFVTVALALICIGALVMSASRRRRRPRTI
jgi:hypothetical protein